MDEIASGLWRWTAPHRRCRAYTPDHWDEYVGSVLYENGDTAVFIDPLLPTDDRVDVAREARRVPKGLLELPVDRVLVSHGKPVLSGALDALRSCLSDHEPT